MTHTLSREVSPDERPTNDTDQRHRRGDPTMEPTEQLAEILAALNETVGQIRTDQLDNPTPCHP